MAEEIVRRLDHVYTSVYDTIIDFKWDEEKRRSNIEDNNRRIVSAGKVAKMARQYIRQYSPDELKELVARGDYTLTSLDAPEIELDEDFWRNARVVMPDEKGKTSISLRVDTEVLEWFKKQGKGHLTRMNAVLRAYVAAQKEQR